MQSTCEKFPNKRSYGEADCSAVMSEPGYSAGCMQGTGYVTCGACSGAGSTPRVPATAASSSNGSGECNCRALVTCTQYSRKSCKVYTLLLHLPGSFLPASRSNNSC